VDLLIAGREFVLSAKRLPGVRRIILLGSVWTSKPNPKDIDFVVVIEPDIDLSQLAACSRRLKGRAQNVNRGADIFLATDDGTCLGRICHHRECWPRRLCRARHCGRVPHLNDDLDVIELPKDTIERAPVTVWPNRHSSCALPPDLASWLSSLEPGAD